MSETERRKSALRTAWIIAAIAIGIYVGFYILVGTA